MQYLRDIQQKEHSYLCRIWYQLYSYMFRLLFIAIFRKHQYTLKDIYSVSTELGKIQYQNFITTPMYSVNVTFCTDRQLQLVADKLVYVQQLYGGCTTLNQHIYAFIHTICTCFTSSVLLHIKRNRMPTKQRKVFISRSWRGCSYELGLARSTEVSKQSGDRRCDQHV